MNLLKRLGLIFVVVLVLISCLPVSAFAVDPVSASVIANSFAQAISAYGASNGVSMVFENADSSNIGENVHELWKSFRDGSVTGDDWDSLAASLFPSLYYKAEVATAGALAANFVGMHITSEYAEVFDEFYNWLLSGPAEMVQIDNSYYQWNSETPIGVYSVNGNSLPYFPGPPSASAAIYNASWHPFTKVFRYFSSSSSSVLCCVVGDSERAGIFFVSLLPNQTVQTIYESNGSYFYDTVYSLQGIMEVNGVTFYYRGGWSGLTSNALVPVYSSNLEAINALYSGAFEESIYVAPYDGATTANFPDTADPNYDAVHRAKDIPIDQPWDDTLYGDGTDTLTDEQSQAISDELTNVLTNDTTLDLVDTADPPAPTPEPSEILVPFLPVTLPSFNFSLSGIWHYVREWVSSLGAWFALMFTVWSTLPYAMVVPVYATAVVVIVLGVYKRFFM